MAVTSVTGVTDLGSVDNQSITKIVFCNIGLKNEQKGRFSNKAVVCCKILQGKLFRFLVMFFQYSFRFAKDESILIVKHSC